MRAAYIERLGPPDVIRWGELPDPVPGPDEVLVDVRATAVDPVDTFVRSGVFRTPLTFPFVIGRDLVGVVAAAARGFAAGEAVWCDSLGHDGRQGPTAERAAVPADRLYRLPAGVRPEDAVAVLHPAATAHLALFTHGGPAARPDGTRRAARTTRGAAALTGRARDREAVTSVTSVSVRRQHPCGPAAGMEA